LRLWFHFAPLRETVVLAKAQKKNLRCKELLESLKQSLSIHAANLLHYSKPHQIPPAIHARGRGLKEAPCGLCLPTT
jgi:hypothetical protein